MSKPFFSAQDTDSFLFLEYFDGFFKWIWRNVKLELPFMLLKNPLINFNQDFCVYFHGGVLICFHLLPVLNLHQSFKYWNKDIFKPLIAATEVLWKSNKNYMRNNSLLTDRWKRNNKTARIFLCTCVWLFKIFHLDEINVFVLWPVKDFLDLLLGFFFFFFKDRTKKSTLNYLLKLQKQLIYLGRYKMNSWTVQRLCFSFSAKGARMQLIREQLH